jgi:cytoskeleton protein RodZ
LPRGRVSLSLGDSAPRSRSWLWGVAAVVVAVIALTMWHTNGGDSSAWLARLKAGANGAAGGAGSATGASGAVALDQAAASAVVAGQDTPASEAPAVAEQGASETPMPAPLPTAAVPVAPASAVAPAPAVAAKEKAPAAAASEVTEATVGGEATVGIKVTQDSWFSVRQKDGKEVFSGLVHAGESKEVAGEAPFKVTVGNKAGLDSLSLDGQPVNPAKYASAKGNVARFALP